MGRRTLGLVFVVCVACRSGKSDGTGDDPGDPDQLDTDGLDSAPAVQDTVADVTQETGDSGGTGPTGDTSTSPTVATCVTPASEWMPVGSTGCTTEVDAVAGCDGSTSVETGSPCRRRTLQPDQVAQLVDDYAAGLTPTVTIAARSHEILYVGGGSSPAVGWAYGHATAWPPETPVHQGWWSSCDPAVTAVGDPASCAHDVPPLDAGLHVEVRVTDAAGVEHVRWIKDFTSLPAPVGVPVVIGNHQGLRYTYRAVVPLPVDVVLPGGLAPADVRDVEIGVVFGELTCAASCASGAIVATAEAEFSFNDATDTVIGWCASP